MQIGLSSYLTVNNAHASTVLSGTSMGFAVAWSMNQEIHADEQVAQPVLCDKSARHLTSNCTSGNQFARRLWAACCDASARPDQSCRLGRLGRLGQRPTESARTTCWPRG